MGLATRLVEMNTKKQLALSAPQGALEHVKRWGNWAAKWATGRGPLMRGVAGLPAGDYRASALGLAQNVFADVKLGWGQGHFFSTGGSSIIGAAAAVTAIGEVGRIAQAAGERSEGERTYLRGNPSMTDHSYQQREVLQQQKRFEASAQGLTFALRGVNGHSISSLYGARGAGNYGNYGQ